jgi:hypothetical protein
MSSPVVLSHSVVVWGGRDPAESCGHIRVKLKRTDIQVMRPDVYGLCIIVLFHEWDNVASF